MRNAVLLVVVAILLAGCAGVSSPDNGPSAPGQGTASPVEEQSDPTHPWAGQTVAVAIDNQLPSERNVTGLLNRAFASWNGSSVAGGNVTFAPTESRSDADLVVTVTPTISRCGDRTTNTTFRYCVSRLGAGVTAGQPETMQVAGRYADSTLYEVAAGAIANLVGLAPEETGYYPLENVRYEDPWPESYPVVVNVTNNVSPDRNISKLVRESFEYWNDSSQPRDYTTRFVVRPDAPTADVQVRFVENVTECGIETGDTLVGCGPLLGNQTLANQTSLIRIEAGYTDNSTRETIKHEIGHLLGRDHGEEPMPLMSAVGTSTRLPQPNVTERSYPWLKKNFSVYVDAAPGISADEAYEQIRPGLTYYADGAGGWLEADVSFTRVNTSTEADVVLRFRDEGECGFEAGGVCEIDRYGESIDADPSLEYYTQIRMTITATGDTERAWMMGYGLGFVFGAQTEAELPAPLQDVSNSDTEWWR